MEQAEESPSLTSESPLKRKAISMYRLQDPKLWNKISWIRTTFIEDANAGVRKTDFYKYVTEHLGRTGYRDVWHLLKIAYPHVDRVRRGRKYMYWGIRRAEQGILSAPTSSDDQNPASPDGTGEVDETSASDADNDELNEEDREGISDLLREYRSVSPDCHHGNVVACKNLQFPAGVAVKVEGGCTKQDVVIMEFKEKQVFESFEDYEKSRVVDNNGNVVSEKAHAQSSSKDRRNRCQERESGRGVMRQSVSPPLEIFSSEIMVDSKKYNQFPACPPTTAMDCGNSNLKKEFDTQRGLETSREEQDSCYGNSVNQDRKSAAEEQQVSTNCNTWIMECGSSAFGSAPREAAAPNLLEPENINRMCMPLIQDLKRKPTRKNNSDKSQLKKTTNAEDENDPTKLPGSLLAGVCSDSLFDLSSSSASHCDPIIVSVASGTNMQARNEHGSDANTRDANESIDNSQSSVDNSSGNQNTIKSDVEFVVVRDRGIQVCERTLNAAPHNTRQVKQVRPCGQQQHKSRQESKMSVYNNGHTCLATNSAAPGAWQPMYGQTKRNVNTSQTEDLQGKSTASSPRQGSRSTAVPRDAVPTCTVDGRTQRRFPSTLPQTASSSKNVLDMPSEADSLPHSSTKSRGLDFQREILNYPHPLATLRKPSSVIDNRTTPHCTTATPISRLNTYSRAQATRVLPRAARITTTQSFSDSSERVTMTSSNHPMTVRYNQSRDNRHVPLSDIDAISRVRQADEPRSMGGGDGGHIPSHRNDGPLPLGGEDGTSSHRELIRKLLEEHEARRLSTANTSMGDLQVMVDCLSSELEKERTLRLRQEIELRKVENQLNQERKLNERLASLLMKR